MELLEVQCLPRLKVASVLFIISLLRQAITGLGEVTWLDCVFYVLINVLNLHYPWQLKYTSEVFKKPQTGCF